MAEIKDLREEYIRWWIEIERTGDEYRNFKLTTEQRMILIQFARPHIETYESQSFSAPTAFTSLPVKVQVQLLKWIEVFSTPEKYWFDGITTRDLKYFANNWKWVGSSDITRDQIKGAMLLSGYMPKDASELDWTFKATWKLPIDSEGAAQLWMDIVRRKPNED